MAVSACVLPWVRSERGRTQHGGRPLLSLRSGALPWAQPGGHLFRLPAAARIPAQTGLKKSPVGFRSKITQHKSWKKLWPVEPLRLLFLLKRLTGTPAPNQKSPVKHPASPPELRALLIACCDQHSRIWGGSHQSLVTRPLVLIGQPHCGHPSLGDQGLLLRFPVLLLCAPPRGP